MRGFWALYRKEITVYFYSPIAYALATIFLILSGIFFFNAFYVYTTLSAQVMNYPEIEGSFNITELIMRPFFHNLTIVLLLIMPLLTMRLFAEEKKSGTFELIFTYPITDLAVMSAKFFACLTVYICIFIPTIVGPVMLLIYSEPELAPIMVAYLGIILLGGAFVALGIFISSMSENQIVAGVVSFGLVLIMWLIDWLAAYAPEGWYEILRHASFINHFGNFAKGLLDTRDVIYYICFTLLFMFLTLRSLESKRWRG